MGRLRRSNVTVSIGVAAFKFRFWGSGFVFKVQASGLRVLTLGLFEVLGLGFQVV